MTNDSPQTIQLRGQLTSADMRKTEPIHIDVPKGVTNIHVRFSHHPKAPADQRLPHQISLMIFDPNGPRFEISKPDDQGVFINAARATPGGTPGPIPAGRWMIFILVHRLLSDAPVAYTLEVTLSFEPIDAQPVTWKPGRVAPRGPGWYRGDLHAHTIHSDGSWDIPDLVRFWKERGADFMTLSDHNTISGLEQARSLADDALLTLGGIELSTYWGHAVAVGVQRWFDWRKTDGSQITMPELARQVIESGALFTIAHPMHPGDPTCCGCRWEYEEMMPGNAQAVEVWNGYWSPHNQEGVQLFYRWLNRGHRLTATAGTDLHGPPPGSGRGALNVVHAQELSEAAIVAAVQAGRSYISAGPELLLNAQTASGAAGMVGDSLPADDATVTVRWRGGQERNVVRFVVDGKAYREKIVGATGELQWSLAAGQARWCTAELRDPDEGLWALTNPIYFG
jgi:hypothetical protein